VNQRLPPARPNKEKPPRRNPGGQSESSCWRSALDGVAALPICALGGGHSQPHLFANRAREEAAHRVRLPPGSFDQFLRGGTARSFQQVKDLCCLAAIAGSACRLAAMASAFTSLFADPAALLRGGGTLLRPSLRGRNVRLLCASVGLFSGFWLLLCENPVALDEGAGVRCRVPGGKKHCVRASHCASSAGFFGRSHDSAEVDA